MYDIPIGFAISMGIGCPGNLRFFRKIFLAAMHGLPCVACEDQKNSVDDIAAKLDVTRRTVLRDVQEIKKKVFLALLIPSGQSIFPVHFPYRASLEGPFPTAKRTYAGFLTSGMVLGILKEGK